MNSRKIVVMRLRPLGTDALADEATTRFGGER